MNSDMVNLFSLNNNVSMNSDMVNLFSLNNNVSMNSDMVNLSLRCPPNSYPRLHGCRSSEAMEAFGNQRQRATPEGAPAAAGGEGGVGGEVGGEARQEQRNAYAVAVLRRVKQKMDGRDGRDGAGARLSIAEQVEQTIRDATNPDKLCAMYEGWTPWA